MTHFELLATGGHRGSIIANAITIKPALRASLNAGFIVVMQALHMLDYSGGDRKLSRLLGSTFAIAAKAALLSVSA
jgi:hypothetical protein